MSMCRRRFHGALPGAFLLVMDLSAAHGRTQRALLALAEFLTPTPTPEAMTVLRNGIGAYLRSGGTLSLDRAMALPTARQFRRQVRDFAARRALALVPGATPHARALALHGLLRELACRGSWRRARALGGLHADVPELRALCMETLSNGPDPAKPCVPSVATLRALDAAGTSADSCGGSP